jgi:hypothetical protein
MFEHMYANSSSTTAAMYATATAVGATQIAGAEVFVGKWGIKETRKGKIK